MENDEMKRKELVMTKISKHFSLRPGALALGVALLSLHSAMALHNVRIPDERQSQENNPLQRTISLKLPIKDVQFHWEFFDRAELLAGKLLLRVTREGKSEELVVFRDGAFIDGWGPVVKQSMGKTGKEPIYFMFQSRDRYLTAPGDKVEIVLVVKQDLKGIGALLAGHLPAGTYRSEASAVWLTDESMAGIPAGFQQTAAF